MAKHLGGVYNNYTVGFDALFASNLKYNIMGVTTIQSEQIKKSIKEIVDVVKAAGLPCTGEESFDDFVSKAKGHMEKASEHYHAVVMLKDMGKADHDALCTLEVAKAVNVMQQASKFSTLVGF